MPRTELQVQAARNQQSARDKKRATFEMLGRKRRAEEEISLRVPNEDGDVEEVTLLFRAIGAKDYDNLVSSHPPTMEQKAEGQYYNGDTFAPALVAACLAEPVLSEAQVKDIWTSSSWNRAEVMTLFTTALGVCMKGFDVPFTETD